jgi:hypothetical protein
VTPTNRSQTSLTATMPSNGSPGPTPRLVATRAGRKDRTGVRWQPTDSSQTLETPCPARQAASVGVRLCNEREPLVVGDAEG